MYVLTQVALHGIAARIFCQISAFATGRLIIQDPVHKTTRYKDYNDNTTDPSVIASKASSHSPIRVTPRTRAKPRMHQDPDPDPRSLSSTPLSARQSAPAMGRLVH